MTRAVDTILGVCVGLLAIALTVAWRALDRLLVADI